MNSSLVYLVQTDTTVGFSSFDDEKLSAIKQRPSPNGKSFRVVNKSSDFYDFIHKFGILYSTSANKTAEKFDKDFATIGADILVEDKRGFYETQASTIIKLSKKSFKKIR